MRIRKPFAAGFVFLLIAAAFLGLAPSKIPQYKQSDKVLHFVTFLLLTICFYWILETSRRRVINFTLFFCTAGLGIGSELLQAWLPNDRNFDPYDILANVVGSGIALATCSWYHKRMLERKRQAKNYQIVPGDELDDRDVELAEGIASERQESGIIPGPVESTVTEQLDNWDENAEDWEDDEAAIAKSSPSRV